MPEYIFLMHDSGHFEGGSAIGDGACVRKIGVVPRLTVHLIGYVRVNANNLDHAKSLLVKNPHFEAGGTVEIRELPRTD